MAEGAEAALVARWEQRVCALNMTCSDESRRLCSSPDCLPTGTSPVIGTRVHQTGQEPTEVPHA